MKALRVTIRLLGVFLVTLGAVLGWLVGLVLLPWRGAHLTWRNLVFRSWARAILWVIGGRVEVTGEPPRAPFFLVSNHLSYVDIVVLAGHLDAVFVAKSEIAGWPVMGWLSRCMNTVFIDRKQRRDIPRVSARLDQLLDRGLGVVVFPEGTSSSGARVERFRPPLLETAIRRGLPVSHAAITYRTPAGAEPAHLAVCWWGEMEFPRHFLSLLSLPGFRARVVFGEERILERDRKQLAERLWRAVDRDFEPVVAVEGECA